jgi:hypothetical protein
MCLSIWLDWFSVFNRWINLCKICVITNFIILCFVFYAGLGCNAGGSQFCANDGICVFSSGTCLCTAGFYGTQCTFGSFCSSNFCQNGGSCMFNGSFVYCQCQPGWYGDSCSLKSVCASLSPCLNYGTCIDQQSSPFYSCICPPNYFGINCQVKLTQLTCSAPDSNFKLCALWKNSGFCDFSYAYTSIPVPVFCPQQCNLCSIGFGKFCQDNDYNCPIWAKKNLCSILQQLNILDVCRMSCNVCPSQSKRSVINLDDFQ